MGPDERERSLAVGQNNAYANELPRTVIGRAATAVDAPLASVFEKGSIVSRFFRLVVFRILFLVMGFR